MIKKKEDFSRASLGLATAQICHSLGWHSIHQSSHDVLTDVLERYLLFITQTAVKYCQNYSRTVPNLDDVSLTFEQLGVQLHELEDYVQQVESSPVIKPPPKYPYCLSSNQLLFAEDDQFPPKVEVLLPVQIKEEMIEDDKQVVSIKVEEVKPRSRPEDLDLTDIICSNTSPVTSPSEQISCNAEKSSNIDFTRPGLKVMTPKGFTPNLTVQSPTKSTSTIIQNTDSKKNHSEPQVTESKHSTETHQVLSKVDKPPLLITKVSNDSLHGSKVLLNASSKSSPTIVTKIDLIKTNASILSASSLSLSNVDDQYGTKEKNIVKKEAKSSLAKSLNHPKKKNSSKLVNKSQKSESPNKKVVPNLIAVKDTKKDMVDNQQKTLAIVSVPQKEIASPYTSLTSPVQGETINSVTPLKKIIFPKDVLSKSCSPDNEIESQSQTSVSTFALDKVSPLTVSPQKFFVSPFNNLPPDLEPCLTEPPSRQLLNISERDDNQASMVFTDIPTEMPVLTLERHVDDVFNLTEGSTENEVDILSISKDELTLDELSPVTHSNVIFTCGDDKKKKKKKKSVKSEHRGEKKIKKRKREDKKETFIPIPKLTLKMGAETISESAPSKLFIKSEVILPAAALPASKKSKKQKEVKPAAGFYAETITNTSSSMSDVYYCPGCGRPDDGSPMIGCDSCDGWYHWLCVNITVAPADDAQWFCSKCAPVSKKKKKKKKRDN